MYQLRGNIFYAAQFTVTPFFFFSLGDRVVAVNDISLETLTRPKVRIKIVVFTQGIIHLERTQKFPKTNIS